MTVFVVCCILALSGLSRHFGVWMPPLYFRDAAGDGLVRLTLALVSGWIVYVLYHFADPSVVGFYRLFYVVMGLAVVMNFGVGGTRICGVRYRVDVIEHDNLHAALLVCAVTAATGLIFSGSIWGEADPTGDGEGGWWIPVGFFLAGWFSLLIALRLYVWRDTRGVVRRMRRRRVAGDAQPLVLYTLSTGWVLMRAVSGDFYGWSEGLLGVGTVAGMLITHEVIGLWVGRGEDAISTSATPGQRRVEAISYVLWTAGYAAAQRWLPAWAQLI